MAANYSTFPFIFFKRQCKHITEGVFTYNHSFLGSRRGAKNTNHTYESTANGLGGPARTNKDKQEVGALKLQILRERIFKWSLIWMNDCLTEKQMYERKKNSTSSPHQHRIQSIDQRSDFILVFILRSLDSISLT